MSLSMVLPRLRTIAPEARSILVAGITGAQGVRPLVEALRATAATTGVEARVVSLEGSDVPVDGAISRQALASRDALRQTLDSAGLTIVAGRGLANDPSTLLVAVAVDAVILAVRRGRTRRSDLAQVVADIERGGGCIAGSVLV